MEEKLFENAIARQRLFAPFTIEQHSIMSGRLRPVGNKKNALSYVLP
jgi:hypothetical protein